MAILFFSERLCSKIPSILQQDRLILRGLKVIAVKWVISYSELFMDAFTNSGVRIWLEYWPNLVILPFTQSYVWWNGWWFSGKGSILDHLSCPLLRDILAWGKSQEAKFNHLPNSSRTAFLGRTTRDVSILATMGAYLPSFLLALLSRELGDNRRHLFWCPEFDGLVFLEENELRA